MLGGFVLLGGFYMLGGFVLLGGSRWVLYVRRFCIAGWVKVGSIC